MHLTEQEQSQINELVAEVEAESGAQVLVALIGKADVYPEIPWKAFSFAVAVTALVVMLDEWLDPNWAGIHSAVLDVVVILGIGAASGLATMLAPSYARLFLDHLRAETELRQYAQAMFLERSLFATRDRIGLLLLIGVFERQVVLLPDSGLKRHLDEVRMQSVVAEMTPLLAQGRLIPAVTAGLAAVTAVLRGKVVRSGAKDNEIAASVVQERGS